MRAEDQAIAPPSAKVQIEKIANSRLLLSTQRKVML